MEEDNVAFAIATIEYETAITNLEEAKNYTVEAKKHIVAAKASTPKALKLLE